MPSEDYEIELPFGVPPVLPLVQNQLKKYLLCPELLPIHSIDNTQQLWARTPQPSLLLNAETAPTGTSLKVIRHHATGEILGFDEIQIKGCGEKGDNSFSLQRAPGLPTDSVRGSARNLPFWPGGFAEPEDIEDLVKVSTAGLDGEEDLETVPPGFSYGVSFLPDGKTPVSAVTKQKEELGKDSTLETPEPPSKPSNVVNIFDLVEQEKEFFEGKTESSDSHLDPLANDDNTDADIIPKLLPVPPVLQIKNTPRISAKKSVLEWTEELDITEPMKDFKERLPNPALTYNFELDTFQKQAILKLEERQDVFVAAHTSAGKTVVAEYAIALSRKHNCRTVYTSPIKALSNQKYRDFRDKFDDVGLITGDLQKNEKASCLIMTTEILRSMLYGGSDVIRDLEYVVLDEVHYLNDSERGHVWEEVLILLPKHVSVVLLSATVPNFLKFANWVGRTRQKKMYVVATMKRPVPLEHYLYTGWGGATKDNRFMVLGQDGVFNLQKYKEAEDKLSSGKGKAPPRGRLQPAQEKTIWSGLIAHLKKKEGLPVVAFTLSRKRCDYRAQSLASMELAGDLTTKDEKHKIDCFFRDCIERLSKQDRDLPQVVTMSSLLSKGIGVHHSGILPFLKEVVEMLFQVGLVKLLFATETFAMGVNMPARTVLFDTIIKYDGTESRPLRPDEYIQMAGRAGRRGLDDKGIVLLLCSAGLPDIEKLRAMMTGKATELVSKFRLTYSMMLKLLRAGGRLTVSEMMSKSFQEDLRSDQSPQILKNLEEAHQALKEWKRPTFLDPETEEFCLEGLKWIQLRDYTWKKHFTSCFDKFLQPGRVLLICHKNHRCKLGAFISKNNDLLEVVVISNVDEIKVERTTREDDLYATMLSKLFWLAKPRDVFVPGGPIGHELLKVPIEDVVEVTSKSLPKDCIPNPKDFFFMRKCGGIVEELTLLCAKTPDYLQSQNKAYDVKTDFMDLQQKKAPLLSGSCHELPNFQEQLVAAFRKYTLEERVEKYKKMISEDSLQLNDEKERRLRVLKALQYIDNDNQVQMKGRVACGMGSKELMITELVMHNVLTKRPVEEIAALLSGLVFQVKTNEDKIPKYSESLVEGIKAVQQYYKNISDVELREGVQAGPDDGEPNFGLAEVVYNWAKNKPFKEIMDLTDCQEGLIVRCIQQLNELMLDVKLAARMIGDEELETKMDDACKAIKRDIVFSASLYTEMEKEIL